MVVNITFLSFLLFSMCKSIHDAVNTWINCSFFILMVKYTRVQYSLRILRHCLYISAGSGRVAKKWTCGQSRDTSLSTQIHLTLCRVGITNGASADSVVVHGSQLQQQRHDMRSVREHDHYIAATLF